MPGNKTTNNAGVTIKATSVDANTASAKETATAWKNRPRLPCSAKTGKTAIDIQIKICRFSLDNYTNHQRECLANLYLKNYSTQISVAKSSAPRVSRKESRITIAGA